jgi:hypothetical protein
MTFLAWLWSQITPHTLADVTLNVGMSLALVATRRYYRRQYQQRLDQRTREFQHAVAAWRAAWREQYDARRAESCPVEDAAHAA